LAALQPAYITFAQSWIQLNRKDPDAFYNRGIAYDDKSDYIRAIADYNEAICANGQGLSRFSSTTAALYSTKGLGHVSTAARSAVSASALLPFTTCHWPM
jgi:tetratricopeptide (TPR) repeat protein